jgi:hypothetical protein
VVLCSADVLHLAPGTRHRQLELLDPPPAVQPPVSPHRPGTVKHHCTSNSRGGRPSRARGRRPQTGAGASGFRASTV